MPRSPKRGAGLPAGPAGARVSVVVPCYNYGRYLEGCVGSILSQEGVEVDVLIVDDASPDGSVEAAKDIAERDGRVRVLAHERNRGHIATYNEGLALCTGDYTVLLSADDLLVPGALARATAVFAAYPEVGLVYGRCVYFTEEAPLPVPRTATGQHVVWDGIQWAQSRCEIGRGGIVSPEVVVRTKLAQEVGGYRPELPHSGDTEMWLRFALRAGIAYVDADHACYRMHAASMSKSQFSTALADARERTRAYVSAFEDAPAEVASEAQRLHEMAMKGIAREVLWGVCRAYDRGQADEETVEQLVAFASEIYPAASRLSEYRRLRLRRVAGGRWAPRLAPLWFPDLAVHKIRLAQRSFAGNWWWHLRS
jgi:GT2 family glycosyltransferase